MYTSGNANFSRPAKAVPRPSTQADLSANSNNYGGNNVNSGDNGDAGPSIPQRPPPRPIPTSQSLPVLPTPPRSNSLSSPPGAPPPVNRSTKAVADPQITAIPPGPPVPRRPSISSNAPPPIPAKNINTNVPPVPSRSQDNYVPPVPNRQQDNFVPPVPSRNQDNNNVPNSVPFPYNLYQNNTMNDNPNNNYNSSYNSSNNLNYQEDDLLSSYGSSSNLTIYESTRSSSQTLLDFQCKIAECEYKLNNVNESLQREPNNRNFLQQKEELEALLTSLKCEYYKMTQTSTSILVDPNTLYKEMTPKVKVCEDELRLPYGVRESDMNIFEQCLVQPKPILELRGCDCYCVFGNKLYLMAENQCLYIVAADENENKGIKSIEIRIGKVRIPLMKPLPCMAARYPFWYLFKNGDLFYAIRIQQITKGDVDYLDDTLYGYSFFYRNHYTEEEIKLMKSNWNKVAAVVEGGGRAVNRTFVKTASLLGDGMRLGTNTFKDKTEGHKEKAGNSDPNLGVDNSGNSIEVTPEHVEDGTHVFLQGARGLKQGFDTGLGFVGRKTAGGAHFAYKKYESSDYKRKKEREKRIEKINKGTYDPNEQPKEDSQAGSGMLLVGKSGVKAVTSSLAGVKTSIRTVGSDVKDTSLAIAEHKEGKDTMKQHESIWNSVGYSCLGGIYAFQLVRMTSTWYIDAAIATGIGATEYDPDKKSLLAGVPWKCGFMRKRGNMMEPWSLKFAVLRTYSFAVYNSPKESKPSHYCGLNEVRLVRPIDENVVKEKYVFEIELAGDSFYFSLDLTAFPQVLGEQFSDNPQEIKADVTRWITAIQSLAYFQGGAGSSFDTIPIKKK